MADYSYQGQTTVEMETTSGEVREVYLGDSFHRFGFTNPFDNVSDKQYFVQKLTQQITVMSRLSPLTVPDDEYTEFMRIIIENFYQSEGDFTFYELRSYLFGKVLETSQLTNDIFSYTDTSYPTIDDEITQDIETETVNIKFYYNLLLAAVDGFCEKHEQYVEERDMDILSEELQPDVNTDVFLSVSSFVPPLGKVFDTDFTEYTLGQTTEDSITIDTTNFDTVISTLSNRTLQHLNHSDFVAYMEEVIKPIVIVGKYTFRDVLYCIYNTIMTGDDPIIEELQDVIDMNNKEHQIYLKTLYPIIFDVYRQMKGLDTESLQKRLEDNNSQTNLPVNVESDKYD